jgi:hypothetical protein
VLLLNLPEWHSPLQQVLKASLLLSSLDVSDFHQAARIQHNLKHSRLTLLGLFLRGKIALKGGHVTDGQYHIN